MSITLTITGDDPMAVAAMVRLLGIREVTVTPYDLGLTPPVPPPVASEPEPEPEPAETIPEPYPNHTEAVTGDGPGEAPPPLVEPVRRYAGKRLEEKPKADDCDLGLLATLTSDLRPAVDIGVQLGKKRTSCGGVARRLDRLADEGRCERGELPDGKRGYRALSKAGEPLPEPAGKSDQTPTPPAALPQRQPTLRLGDLIGHSLRVAWALHDHGPQTRHELAARLALPEDDVRDTLRLLIRQGYVARLDGNVVRYALTGDVVRDEAALAAGKVER